MTPRSLPTASLLPLALALAFAGPVPALTVDRAELDGDRLRVEGEEAAPGATILVDGEEAGEAEDDGRYKVEEEPFASGGCEIAVGDGDATVHVGLAGCTPSEPVCFADADCDDGLF